MICSPSSVATICGSQYASNGYTDLRKAQRTEGMRSSVYAKLNGKIGIEHSALIRVTGQVQNALEWSCRSKGLARTGDSVIIRSCQSRVHPA